MCEGKIYHARYIVYSRAQTGKDFSVVIGNRANCDTAIVPVGKVTTHSPATTQLMEPLQVEHHPGFVLVRRIHLLPNVAGAHPPRPVVVDALVPGDPKRGFLIIERRLLSITLDY
jgi:hypothetical protein